MLADVLLPERRSRQSGWHGHSDTPSRLPKLSGLAEQPSTGEQLGIAAQHGQAAWQSRTATVTQHRRLIAQTTLAHKSKRQSRNQGNSKNDKLLSPKSRQTDLARVFRATTYSTLLRG